MMTRQHFRIACAWGLLSILCLLVPEASEAQSQAVALFSVHAGPYERADVPVTASLKGVPLRLPAGGLQLYEITGGQDRPVASQLAPGDPGQLTWILAGETPPGAVRTYELRAVAAQPSLSSAFQQVQVQDDGAGLQVRIGDRPVLAYRYALQGVPEGVDEIYDRGGFIHPLWSPEGEVLSRIQPPDHYHHYGIWNPWTHTEFEGEEVDFWNLSKGQGTVRAKQVIERTAGPVFGGFKALHDHVAFTSGEKVALNEQWAVRVWNADPARDVWLVDFVSTMSPATAEPLTIKAYRYQGFSLRATERWNDETATLLTSAGFDKSDANGTRARWLDVNGISDATAGTSGILFMTHPANFNFPEQLRIWPTGMNAGKENVYINFNPAQEQDWVLEPGRTYALQYRMLLYDGTLGQEQAERYWRDFANPPHVEVHPTGALAGARVLVYTKNGEGYVHDNIPYSIAALEKLGAEHGFEVVASDDPAQFTEENLKQYDALIFSNTNNEAFANDAQRRALQAYIRSGGGFVGIHSASGSERDWPWFSRLLGGNFVRHAPRQDFTAVVVDRAHPSTAFLPDTWAIEDDECYYLKELSPNLRAVLAADLATVSDPRMEEFPGDLFGDRFPLAWYQTFDGGRQWYTSLGHRPEHYEDARFLRHILGGIQWAVGGVSP